MTSPAPTPSLGRRLLDQGWRQGALLPAHGTEHTWARRREVEPGAGPVWEWERTPCASEDWWVLASQDCDIAAKAESRVEFLRAFWTADKSTLRAARLNSARNHLLARRTRVAGKEEGLVVDATVHLRLEKESLLELSPSRNEAPLTPEGRRRFAEWLARRYSRPAIPDVLVRAVQKPLVESMRELKEDDELWLHLDKLDQVRFSVLEDAPPFTVSLLCLLASGSELSPLDEADVQGWFSEVLDGQEDTRLAAVEFRSAESISLADFLSRTPLPLGEFSLEDD